MSKIIEQRNKSNLLLSESIREVLKAYAPSTMIGEVLLSYGNEIRETDSFLRDNSSKNSLNVRKAILRKKSRMGDTVTVSISSKAKREDVYAKVINYNPSQSLKSKHSYLPKRKGALHHSEISINPNSKVKIIPSKIIKITPTMVVFECITDVKNQCYETREFPIILFQKYSFLKVGLVCNLNITLSPNTSNLKITNLDDSKIEKLFDTSDLFDELEGFENVPYN